MTHPAPPAPASVAPIIHLVGHDTATEARLADLLDSVALPWRAHRDAAGFLGARDPARPGCALVNPRLPDVGGLELQEDLQRRDEGPSVVFISGPAQISAAVRAMRAGAVDFLCKPLDDERLLAAVRRALARDRRGRHRRGLRARAGQRLNRLTPRERQTLEAVVNGHTNKSIARTLSISPKTVELHRSRMMRKLGEGSVAGAVRLYLSAAGDDPARADADQGFP